LDVRKLLPGCEENATYVTKNPNHTTQSTIKQRKSMEHSFLDAATPNSSKWHSECKSFSFYFLTPNDCIYLKKYSARYAHPKYNKML
jgi:hypothetical protein